MKKTLKSIGKRLVSVHIRAVIGRYCEDFFIFGGISFIVYATFRVNETAGYYCLGACLFGLGVWTWLHPMRRR